MRITDKMKMQITTLSDLKATANKMTERYRNGLKELYTLFLKENGLDGYICHKANVGCGEQSRAVLYVKQWDNDNIEIRYKLTNDVHDMDKDYPACSRNTTDPIKIMQEILDNYVPYEKQFTNKDDNVKVEDTKK